MAEGLQNLITLLDAEVSDRPGESYEAVRRRLIRFFEWQMCPVAEDLADETIDRVAKRVNDGEKIDKLIAFFYGVARRVLKEYERARERERRAFATLPTSSEDAADDGEELKELRNRCSHQCFNGLPDGDRSLMIAYCKPDGRPAKERRLELAAELGLTIEQLRVKVFRIREKLDACVEECLKA